MSLLFIIGNGFDVAHGIPTAYKEFRNWILELHPDSLGTRTLNEFIQSLRKDTGKQLRKYSDFFSRLGSEIDKVYSYGFSYSSVDSPFIKGVIQHISPDATWYFTAHKAKNSKEFGKRKSKLRRYGFKGKFDVFNG